MDSNQQYKEYENANICELEDGRAHIYYIASEKSELGSFYSNLADELEYIGYGKVLAINGQIERSEEKTKYHFWRKK